MGVAVLLFALLVLLFTSFAHQLGRWNISAPIAFVAAGAFVGFTSEPPGASDVIWIKVVTKVTLALVLFHDAAQVRPRDLSDDRGLLARVLGVAFPLTILVGFVLALWLFPGQPIALALLVAAALSPTDAGLSAGTILNPVVPVRVRRLLNEEGGFNDGLATPVVLFAIAALAGSEGLRPAFSLAQGLVTVLVGVGFGTLVGVMGAWLLGLSRSHGWSTTETRALGVVTLPLIAYGGAEQISGNGLVAAFIAGTSLVGAGRWLQEEHAALHLTEVLTGPLGFAVWCLFGLVAVPSLWGAVGWREMLYAVLSLTVVRMLPMALALIGTGFRLPTLLFLGWFGPRGLVSVLFALMAVDSLLMDDPLREALLTVTLTVALSVLAHGLSAVPLAQRYGRWVQRAQPAAELSGSSVSYQPQPRGSILRGSPAEPG